MRDLRYSLDIAIQWNHRYVHASSLRNMVYGTWRDSARRFGLIELRCTWRKAREYHALIVAYKENSLAKMNIIAYFLLPKSQPL